MPRGDRTGPDGMGRMTGKGLGYCAQYESPGYTRGIPQGIGGFFARMGRRFSQGMGSRRFWNSAPVEQQIPQYSAESEEKYQQADIVALKEELKALENRLSQLSTKDK
ncbi:DUF5320 domain-containing protein [Candidatus Cloacimonadota bacterium]